MSQPILSPLDYFLREAQPKHAQFTDEYIDNLLGGVTLDREKNAEQANAYRAAAEQVAALQRQVKNRKRARAWSIVGVVTVFLGLCFVFFSLPIMEAGSTALTAAALILSIIGIVLICKRMNKSIRILQEKIGAAQTEAETHHAEALRLAEPLNALFQGTESLSLVKRALPFLAFDDCFTAARLQEFVNGYGYAVRADVDSCVTDLLSGELYGNPFFYERRLTHRMGTKTYTGSLMISWQTRSRDAQGRTVTKTHTQTLHASITRPKPYYELTTDLHYGHEAVAELSFSRVATHAEDESDAALERKIRRGERKLEKLEEKAAKQDRNFTGVTNLEFEVVFGATNRNDEWAYREMYTPRAQEQTLKLLLYEEGYGDDFDFTKNGKLNTLRVEHSQHRPLSLTADEFRSYDIALAEQAFREKNKEFFKAIYFDFAPLLCVPVYQDPLMRSEAIRGGGLTEYNFEMLARRFYAAFAPYDAETAVIFKSARGGMTEQGERILVSAYAYRTEPRREYVTTLGGDGKFHQVPVDWTEYIPVQGGGEMYLNNEARKGSIRCGEYYAFVE